MSARDCNTPITPEQVDAFDAYQRARTGCGLLTADEHAAIVGGRPSDEYMAFEQRGQR